ncbi:MAG: MFS transporter [Saprospiraceae bacterium]
MKPIVKSRQGILLVIVVAQFLCVSTWFAGNGVMGDLITAFQLSGSSLGHLTSAVQFGFIAGTFLYALFAIADRFSPSRVFLISALLAAICNLGTIFTEGSLTALMSARFMTGFFLAGIYPVGMKIAADYYDKDLGKALGFLLGALVAGTAFPHFLKTVLSPLPWDYVLISTSLLTVIGGLLLFFMVPDGPFRQRGTGFNRKTIFEAFRNQKFRASAFGYFGHMWELYAFWAFLPVILAGVFSYANISDKQISLDTFYIIGIGTVSCIIGGYVSQKIGSYKVAFIALTCSAICCLLSPIIFSYHHYAILWFLLFWGMAVMMDSPQFSTMIAQSAPAENKASALTIINCIGFSITIVSIQFLNLMKDDVSYRWLLIFLLPGPLLGLIGMLGVKGWTSNT